MSDIIIDLNEYRTPGQPVLSGNHRGVSIRNTIGLDSYDDNPKQILIDIPEDILIMTSSFFLGLFSKSVKKFGSKEIFQNHYSFKCNERVLKTINNDIEIALKTTSIL